MDIVERLMLIIADTQEDGWADVQTIHLSQALAEIASLRQKLHSSETEYRQAHNDCVSWQEEAARLRSELEAARKDAALYHYARDECGIRVVPPNGWTVSEIAKGA